MIYTATITSASLRLRESRIVADLLLRGTDDATWREVVVDQNILKMKSTGSIRRVAGLLRARIEPLGPGLWTMVRDGGRDQATQAVFSGAVKNSRLLGDFMDITMREQLRLFAEKLEPRMWNDYLAGCRGRDPDMPRWSDTTQAKLRSAVFSMLSETGYLESTRSMLIQNVFLDSRLADYLEDRGEHYVLRCMRVTE